MKRIGLIGCGTVAGYGHLPAIAQVPELHLAALLDPNPEHLNTAGEKFDVPAARRFTDCEAFFHSGLDAVVVTSPAPAHRQNVLDAARCNQAVLCEKPLAMTTAEAQTMLVAMEDANLPLFTAFCYRFSPSSQKIRDLVRQRAIGDVRSLRLIYNWDLHGRYVRDAAGKRIEQPRRVQRMREGGPLVDCGVHQIDLARWWLGSEVVRQRAVGVWVEEYEAPDHIYVHMEHENGAYTTVEVSYTYCHTAAEPRDHFVYELIGTDGLIRYCREEQSFEVRTRSGTTRFPFHHEKDFVGMYRAFAQALETGQPGDLATGEDGLIATSLARQATDAAITDRLFCRI